MRLVKYSNHQLDDLFRLTPFSVGFDSMFDRLLNMPETASGSYPPYDIVKKDSMNYLKKQSSNLPQSSICALQIHPAQLHTLRVILLIK